MPVCKRRKAITSAGAHRSEIRDLKPGMAIRGTDRIVRKPGQGGMGSVYEAACHDLKTTQSPTGEIK
jgi:hypothetical protein